MSRWITKMPIQAEKLKKLQEILKQVDSGLTREEFTVAFKKLMEVLAEIKKNLEQKIDSKTQGAKEKLEELQDECKEMILKIEKDNQSTLPNLKKWVLERIGDLYIRSRINEKIAELDEALANIKDGVEGPIGPVGPQGAPGSPDTPEEVRDKLELLDGDERLDRTAIRGITVSPQAPDNPKNGDIWIQA